MQDRAEIKMFHPMTRLAAGSVRPDGRDRLLI